MKFAIKVAAAPCEVAIAAAILWKHTALFEFTVPLFLLLLSPLLFAAHVVTLKNEGVPRGTLLTLSLLTGPCALLGLSLALALSYELKAVQAVGGATKEMSRSAGKGCGPLCPVVYAAFPSGMR
ncbi:MAG TPA: hypothetical protein PK867_07305, partial [Pirellulales bacterium]|nr:hypothetical protein [Pirellulales bacterium]